jgi:hypothetical protein
MTYQASCHCGAVQFAIDLDLSTVSRCNCSICTKSGNTGAIAKPGDLRVLAGEDALATYVWGGRTATRYFCSRCGIHCFLRGHLPELGGDYVAINVNCLDGIELAALPVVHWDGRHNNWDAGPRATPWPVLAA